MEYFFYMKLEIQVTFLLLMENIHSLAMFEVLISNYLSNRYFSLSYDSRFQVLQFAT